MNKTIYVLQCAQGERRGGGVASYCMRHADCNTTQTVNDGHATHGGDLSPRVKTHPTAAGIQLLVEREAARGRKVEKEKESKKSFEQ